MSPRLSLPEFFHQVFLPHFLAGGRAATAAEYQTAVRYWQRLVGPVPLSEITAAHLLAFRSALMKQPGRRSPTISHATVNKHLRSIQTILDRAGPPGPGRRDALGLIHEPPWLRPLRTRRKLPRHVDDAEILRLYTAAANMTLPTVVPPADWWRALIVTAITTGFRREALLALTWQDIDLVRRLVRVPAEADKTWAERVKPLATVTVRHLVRIRTSAPAVFRWPYSERTWSRHWDRLRKLAHTDVTFHDLKRACGTRVAAIAPNPHVVQRMLDHADLSTSLHYVNA